MTTLPNSSSHRRRWRWSLLAASLISVIAYAMVGPRPADPPPVAPVSVATPADTVTPSAPAATTGAQPAAPAALPAEPPVVVSTVSVQRRDTLSRLLARSELTAPERTALLGSDALQPLKRIHPGETLRFHRRDATLVRVEYQPEPHRTWIIEADGAGFAGRWETRPIELRVVTRHLVIDSSLYAAAQAAGLSEKTIAQLADLFGWDVDFALDIRRGDQLALVIEERWLDGARLADGDIIAARLLNDGKSFDALRFERPDGGSDYFDLAGNSLRKQFLRSPVDFRRISSRFQANRWHPVLGVKRPHRGVDYAASPGTPVRATGDGTVAEAGNRGGYGRTVVIRHGQGTQTLYAHLKGFAKGLRAGQRVRQGQLIGFVGSSGLASGPHLHYEFQVNGVHRNPLTVRLPNAAPLAAADRERFSETTRSARTALDLLLGARLAQS